MSDRHFFNSFVYTPLEQAIQELELRRNDAALAKYLRENMHCGIPGIFEGTKNAILGRQIATPNFEFKKFSSLIDRLPGFKKTMIVKHNDKFTPGINETKFHLGKIVFNSGVDQEGKTNSIMAVNFNLYAGKPLSEVRTIWDQDLVSFHNDLLEYSKAYDLSNPVHQFEGSKWLAQLGKSAKEYYPKLLLLFLQHGILFENFLLKEKGETAFTKEVFLPAFFKVMEETGVKPLIISFLPIETEGSNYWNHYPEEYYRFVRSKLNLVATPCKKVAA